MNHYEILGIPKNATADQIKSAYKKLAMKHHPDRGGDEVLFKQITTAYEAIKNPQPFHNELINAAIWIDFKTSILGGTELVQLKINNQLVALSLEIPQSVADGTTIFYKNIQPGLHARIQYRIEPNEKWHREGYNLFTYHSLDIWDLILGTEISITTLYDEKLKVIIPKQTQPDTQFRLSGKGIKNRQRAGDLFILLKAVIPNNIPDELLEHIKKVKYHAN